MTFGERLLYIRKKRGLSQEQLGEKTGLDKRIISRYENDKTQPNIGVVKRFSDALQVSIDYLLDIDLSVFIDDPEMRNILKDYNDFDESERRAIKEFMKAWSVYHRMKATEKEISSTSTTS